MNKIDIKKAILAELLNQITDLKRSIDDAMDATTHDDAKSEGKYDTRAIESGYLAEAQAKRLNELEVKLAFLRGLTLRSFTHSDQIEATALVGLGKRWLLILPKIGGMEVKVNNVKITVVTPDSNLGQELLESMVDDEVRGDLIHALS